MESEYTLAESEIVPVAKPIQKIAPQFGVGIESVEVDRLIGATKARTEFGVSGKNLGAAVCDTGINSDHVDFSDRIPVQANFTADNNGERDNARDGQGHGTNVSGIIVANGDHIGVAPDAYVVPIKVLDNTGSGSFSAINDALSWVLTNHMNYNISVVCMSLGGPRNFQSDSSLGSDGIKLKIQSLKSVGIPVVIAAGNDFFKHASEEGMSYPAIIRECISVGAVYDDVAGDFGYKSGATASSTAPDRITPFSQRLHASTNSDCFTDIFAPGAPVTSSGIDGPNGESTQHGTSQATPVTCGVILLAQEFHQRLTGHLPDVDQLIHWIRLSGQTIFDGDDEADNVKNTNKSYVRIDVPRLLSQIKREIEVDTLKKGNLLKSNLSTSSKTPPLSTA